MRQGRYMGIVLLLMLAALPAFAQAWGIRRVPRYAFSHFERNAIRYPSGQAPEFDAFLRKLDTLVLTGRGQVRVLQVGGSHVQGGGWTGQLRRNFLSLRYGMDGGRGLVFPYAAAGTNTPTGYWTSYTGNWEYSRCLKPEHVLGVTGMAVSTVDSAATVTIDLADPEHRPWKNPRYMFRSVDVLGYGDLDPFLLLGRDTVRGERRGERWHFDLPHYAEWCRVGFTGFPGRFTLQGLYLDKDADGLTFSEAGVNGAATGSFLKCDDWQRDVAFLRPDLVIFSLGINDIQTDDFSPDRFVAQYARLVRQVREVLPHCAILFTTLSDSYRHRSPNPSGETASQALCALAEDCDAALWDLFDIMGGLGSIQLWNAAGLAGADRIHFTPEGYRLVADLMFNAFLEKMQEL